MNPLVFLGLIVGVSWGTGAYLNKEGLTADNFEPKIGGVNASVVLGGIGALIAIFGGPFGLLVGSGLATAAVVSNNGTGQARAYMEKYLADRITAIIAADPNLKITDTQVSDLATNILDMVSPDDDDD